MKLIIAILVMSLFEPIWQLENNSGLDSYDENENEPADQDTWTHDDEYNSSKSSVLMANGNSEKTINASSDLSKLVRDQLQIELRKLKSTVTDSIMEELINYYGKQFASNDALKQEIESLSKKINVLTQNFNSLGQSYKTLSASHRNLVDVVRNNIIRLKKERRLATSRRNANGGNTRALVDSNYGDHTSIEPITTTQTILTRSIMPETLSSSSNSHLVGEHLEDIILNSPDASSYDIDNNSYRIVRHEDKQKNLRKTEIDEKSELTDCQDLLENGFKLDGVYKVYSPVSNTTFDVYCEFEDNIGWTLLQYRYDGKVNFYQNWKAYKSGFGNLVNKGEFWLGLENMHILTSQQNYSLQVEITDWKNSKYIAEYESFKVDSEKNKYKLELMNYLKNTSTAGDSLGDSLNSEQSHNNMAFSTFDNDNDNRFYDNCAQIFKSGWWFNACFQSNLNGIYYRYSNSNENQTEHNNANKSARVRINKQEENSQLRFLRNGIHWNSIDFYKSLKATKLRIRRR